MAMIKINDLTLHKKLDQQAMSTVLGGLEIKFTDLVLTNAKSRTTAQQPPTQQVSWMYLPGSGS